MIRILALALLAIWTPLAFSADDVAVPEGVKYKKASDEINEQARQKVLKVFKPDMADKEVLAFFESKTLICGPGLWDLIKTDPAMAKTGEGRVTFEVPILDKQHKPTGKSNRMKGQLFQTDEGLLAFWKVVFKADEFKEITIRKLTPAELKIYWAIISFDITEPLFVVEGKKQRILLQFTSPEKLRVAWIDDLANLEIKGQK